MEEEDDGRQTVTDSCGAELQPHAKLLPVVDCITLLAPLPSAQALSTSEPTSTVPALSGNVLFMLDHLTTS